MAVYVNVGKSNLPEGICGVPAKIIEALHLVPGQRYRMKLGQCSINVQVSKSQDSSGITLGTTDYMRLGIPEPIRLGIALRNNEIILGPVLGIFVNPRYFRRIARPAPPGGCRNMTKANKHHHLLIYFFTISDIDWKEKMAIGWYYSPKQKAWVKTKLPLPDIIYDRGVFNRREEATASEYRNRFIKMFPIRRINPGDCLDKYWLYRRLRMHKELVEYLPETIKLTKSNDLFRMLKKYSTVYLKSFYGSLGSEVMAVKLNPDATFHCMYFKHGVPKTCTLQDKSSLLKLVSEFFRNKEFVIQQGIHLLQYNHSRVDMRVLLQKNGRGNWVCVYNVAFLGQKNSLITAGEEKGAKPYNFAEIMPLVLNLPVDKVNKINTKIVDVCKKFCNAIDKEYGEFGEIGLDMALDTNLNIWYIEANSKPDRELEYSIIGDARCRMSCMYIIEYTKYLSGFYSRKAKSR